MNLEDELLADVKKAAECKYNEGVICGIWDKPSHRCDKCRWNPNRTKEKSNDQCRT